MTAAEVTPDYFIAHYMEFLPRYIASGRPAEDTLCSYNQSIRTFIDWCGENNQHPFMIMDYQMRVYVQTLYKRNLKDTSIANYIAGIRAFYYAAVKMELIDHNPCQDIKLPSTNPYDEEYHFYTISQLNDILTVFDSEKSPFLKYRNSLIVYLMGVEGLRSIEVHRLNDEDINYGTMSVIVHGKGHQGIIYPCDETFDILKKYLDNRPEVEKENMVTPTIVSNSNNHANKRISRVGLRYIMNQALVAADLKYPGSACHIFRHSCGTNLYQQTKDLRIVQETLRQRDPKVTARYAHVHERMSRRYTSGLAPRRSE